MYKEGDKVVLNNHADNFIDEGELDYDDVYEVEDIELDNNILCINGEWYSWDAFEHAPKQLERHPKLNLPSWF